MEIKKHFCSFSEAIREGAKLRPQGFGALVSNRNSCALGAGYEAMGVLRYAIYSELVFEFPYMGNRGDCPTADCETMPCLARKPDLGWIVVHLNDFHKWTREAIADWLETEEEKLGYITLTENEETNETKTVTASAGNHALQLS